MNVFVLSTGRCGSLTFKMACSPIENYTSGHESRAGILGPGRLKYPQNHIEVDNRLSWFLGRLEQQYGNNAYYVHLKRHPDQVAVSYCLRLTKGIMPAYHDGIYIEPRNSHFPLDTAYDYIKTVEANISLFLRDKTQKMEVHVEQYKEGFTEFWHNIQAKGSLDLALRQLDFRYNKTDPNSPYYRKNTPS